MGRIKRCVYGSCRSDTRYLKERNSVFFIPFPKPKTKLAQCNEWILRCGRLDDFGIKNINRNSFICSLHFEGGNGPTDSSRNPLDFRLTEEYKTHKELYFNDTKGNPPTSMEEETGHDSINLLADALSFDLTDESKTSSDIDFPENNVYPSTSMENEYKEVAEENDSLGLPSCNFLTQIHEESTSHTSGELTTQEISVGYDQRTEVLSQSIDYMDSSSVLEYEMPGFLSEIAKKAPKEWAFSYNEAKMQLVFLKFSFEAGTIIISMSLTLPMEKDIGKPVVLLKVYNKLLPEKHLCFERLNDYLGEAQLITSNNIFQTLIYLDGYNICKGVDGRRLREEFENISCKTGYISFHDNSLRSITCDLLTTKDYACQSCKNLNATLRKRIVRRKKLNSTPRLKRAKTSTMSRKSLIEKIKFQRRKQNYSNAKIFKMQKLQKEIKNQGLHLEDSDSKALLETLERHKSDFEKNTERHLFIEEQLKALKHKDPRSRRWHPKIIQWCIYLQNKSPSAYEAMQKSSCFILPSRRTLYNYSYHFGAKSGFTVKAFEELKKKTEEADLEDWQHYYSILLDEMKIKEDIVYKNNTGELIGFVSLNDFGNALVEEQNLLKSAEYSPVATHVLQLMVQGITNNIRFPLAHFPCDKMNSDTLSSIVGEAISKLEFCGIRILAIIADGASTNRKVLNNWVDESGFKCKNVYALDSERDLFFICDPPHLIKTTRNCFSKSGDRDHHTRSLTKNGQKIFWNSIIKLFDEDVPRKIKQLPKLTLDHIYLTSYSRMKVSLAAQVLSDTVANALEKRFGSEVKETVKFIRFINKFFDLMNVRNYQEGFRKRNDNLKPYENISDLRLKWCEDEFVSYLDDWEKETQTQESSTAKEKCAMILSKETMSGLKITAKSVVAIVKFLLSKGARFVLTNRLNQDNLEREFGKHRAACGGNNNPSASQYAQNIDKLRRVQNVFKLPKNTNTSTVE